MLGIYEKSQSSQSDLPNVGSKAGVTGTGCNVPPVLVASRVIVGADFVASSEEVIVKAEVV